MDMSYKKKTCRISITGESRGEVFGFLFEAATQLARKVHQEHTQVRCSNKVDWSRLALRHSRY